MFGSTSHPRRPLRLMRTAAAVAVFAVAGAAGCSGTNAANGGDGQATLTVYTDQHAELVKSLTDTYTKKTGVQFNIQPDATVGQIEAEGDAAPADVFLSEDPGPVAQLGKKHLLTPIDKSTLKQVRPGLSSGSGLWVAYAARARVLFYNPELIAKKKLPKTLLDIAEPRYKGTFAWAPSGAFVATTQYLISTIGADETRQFLQALKENGTDEHENGNVRDTVEAGKHAMGLSNHYYWWIKAAEVGGPDKMTSKIYHFPTKDPGNLVLSSGAGILKSSDQPDQAADFVQWLTSKDGGQKVLANGDVDVAGAQYPVAVGTRSKVVGSISEVKSPKYDMDIMANVEQAEKMLKTLGMSS